MRSLVVMHPQAQLFAETEMSCLRMRRRAPAERQRLTGPVPLAARLQQVARNPHASRRLACLLGGAIGDALGYRVVCHPRDGAEWGLSTEPPPAVDITAPLVVSDETQLTLFTLEGMTRASDPAATVRQVRAAYLDWLATQGFDGRTDRPRGRLGRHRLMRRARAADATCIEALRQGGDGTPKLPLNESRSPGAVVRSAPLAFFGDEVDDAELFQLSIAVGALTHGHPDAYLPAAAMTILTRDALRGTSWQDSLERVLPHLHTTEGSRGTVCALERVVTTGSPETLPTDRAALSAPRPFGTVTLAIGLYAALRATSFKQCIRIAVSHDGTVDATASIAGQLYGARHGLEVLPLPAVERLDVIEPLLEAMEAWESRPPGR